jgi:cell division protein FtsL
MKNLVKISVWATVMLLVAANIILFRSSIGVGGEIEMFEKKTKAVHEENLKLEKKISSLTSLEFAKQVANELDFSKVSTPTFLEALGVAVNYRP